MKTLFDEIVNLYESGMSQQEVADSLFITRMKVRWEFKKHNYICRSKKEIREVKGFMSDSVLRTKRSWISMIYRCSKGPGYKRYSSYRGKGIIVCDRWLISFENFLQDMGERPEGMSIDRRDNNGNYEPSNCRWATSKEQMNNTDFNINIEFKGETKTLSQWSETLNIKRSVLNSRIKRGWTIEKAFSMDNFLNRFLTYKGETKTIGEWSSVLGINQTTLSTRLRRRWSIERAFETPSDRNTITVTLNGKTQNLYKWINELGLRKSTVINRIKRGWTPEEALTKIINIKHKGTVYNTKQIVEE